METNIAVRPAVTGDLEAVMEVLAEARAYQGRVGNPQWRADYPPLDLIRRDIAGGGARVLVAGGRVAGYAVAVCRDEGYRGVALCREGDGRRWCVIHRLALGDALRGRGLARRFLALLCSSLADEGMEEIRIDTGEANLPMRHTAGRLGFECLGTADFPWGPRLVFRLLLKPSNKQ